MQSALGVYVTYDLPQKTNSGHSEHEPIIRGAKEVRIDGEFVRSKVGEFTNASGAKSSGVQIEFIDPVIGPSRVLIEVPAAAQNVQLRDELPADYRSAIQTAA